MPGPAAAPIELDEQEYASLEELTRRHSTAQQKALRARVVLAAGMGLGNTQIARFLNVSVDMVQVWRNRWISLQEMPREELSVEERLEDLPRCGTPARISAEQYTQIMAVACEPPQNAGRPITHWSIRELVEEVVQRGIVSSISERQMRRFLQRG